jgi:hypothetical protein
MCQPSMPSVVATVVAIVAEATVEWAIVVAERWPIVVAERWPIVAMATVAAIAMAEEWSQSEVLLIRTTRSPIPTTEDRSTAALTTEVESLTGVVPTTEAATEALGSPFTGEVELVTGADTEAGAAVFAELRFARQLSKPLGG